MTRDRIAERAAEILPLSANLPRVKALSDQEREEWARGQAESELARDPYLPGGLSWAKIESAYRELAAQRPVHPFRRQKPDQPSRPEVAGRLMVSTATLDRACIEAGRGGNWPPRGF